VSEHVYLTKGDFVVCAVALEYAERYCLGMIEELKEGKGEVEGMDGEELGKVLEGGRGTRRKVERVLEMGVPDGAG